MTWRNIKPLKFMYNMSKKDVLLNNIIKIIKNILLILFCIGVIISVYFNIKFIHNPNIYTQEYMNKITSEYEYKINDKNNYIHELDDELIELRSYKEEYEYSEEDIDNVLEEYKDEINNLEKTVDQLRAERRKYIKNLKR